MIQVTLTFSSIAAAIQALRGIPEADQAVATVKEAPAKPQAEKTATPAASPAATPAAASASAKKQEPAASQEPAADEGVLDYAVLQKAVFALAGKSRDAALAVNQQFNVKTMKELPEDKRREALAAVNAKIAELEVA
jgi:hypothetical protein